MYHIDFRKNENNGFHSDFLNWFYAGNWSFIEFVEALFKGIPLKGIFVSQSEIKAINVYSPFSTIRAIKAPALNKWRIDHVWKAILSGQIQKVFCDLYLTDDYADDAYRNFQKGERNALEFAQMLVNEKSGWWVHAKAGADGKVVLSVNCHHFNYNSMIFNN